MGLPTIFRTSYRDDQVAPKLIELMSKDYRGKKIAVVHDKGAYGADIAAEVLRGLTPVFGDTILNDSFDENARDFSALITRLKQEKIEVLFIGSSNIVGAGAMTRQIGEAGLHIQIIGGDFSDPDFWRVADHHADGALFVLPSIDMDDAKIVALKKKFDATGHLYNQYSFQAYAAGDVLAAALSAKPDATNADITKALHRDSFATVLGAWRFNQKGDRDAMPMAAYRWRNGAYREVKE
jgi:branched-chain amino acid transport system substrate-binding protein